MKIIRGWFGEKKTTFYMWLSLNARVYQRFHNVIIPSRNGTAQIDHLFISPYGLFIVETKNMKGWIFGSEDKNKWTQSVYGNNYSFQNPIKQTFRQKKVLAEFLNINESVIQPVIYFVGDCSFKTHLPENVIKRRLGRYIKQFKHRVLPSEEITRIVAILEQHVSKSTLKTRDHVRSLRERHNSSTLCPNCGSNLVVRTVKKGPNAGLKFLGCENYPSCRFTRNA